VVRTAHVVFWGHPHEEVVLAIVVPVADQDAPAPQAIDGLVGGVDRCAGLERWRVVTLPVVEEEENAGLLVTDEQVQTAVVVPIGNVQSGIA